MIPVSEMAQLEVFVSNVWKTELTLQLIYHSANEYIAEAHNKWLVTMSPAVYWLI